MEFLQSAGHESQIITDPKQLFDLAISECRRQRDSQTAELRINPHPRIETVRSWERSFGDISRVKVQLIDTRIPFIEHTAELRLDMMTIYMGSLIHWQLSVTFNSRNRQVTIQDPISEYKAYNPSSLPDLKRTTVQQLIEYCSIQQPFKTDHTKITEFPDRSGDLTQGERLRSFITKVDTVKYILSHLKTVSA